MIENQSLLFVVFFDGTDWVPNKKQPFLPAFESTLPTLILHDKDSLYLRKANNRGGYFAEIKKNNVIIQKNRMATIQWVA